MVFKSLIKTVRNWKTGEIYSVDEFVKNNPQKCFHLGYLWLLRPEEKALGGIHSECFYDLETVIDFKLSVRDPQTEFLTPDNQKIVYKNVASDVWVPYNDTLNEFMPFFKKSGVLTKNGSFMQMSGNEIRFIFRNSSDKKGAGFKMISDYLAKFGGRVEALPESPDTSTTPDLINKFYIKNGFIKNKNKKYVLTIS